MRNVFRALKEEHVQPALALVNANVRGFQDELVISRRGLVAADAAAALGLDPCKTILQLWQEKTSEGAVRGSASAAGAIGAAHAACASDETSAAYWSSLLEPLIASVYTKRTGNRLRRLNVVRSHVEHPWMLANMGWEVVGADGVQVFDCMSVGKDDLALWRDGFPAHLRMNVLHLLAVTGKQGADIGVLLGGLELCIYRIERDEEAIEQLLRLEAEFWNTVERDERPPVRGCQLKLELVQC